jgi:cbb3-type cytochrome oxidase subunit 3
MLLMIGGMDMKKLMVFIFCFVFVVVFSFSSDFKTFFEETNPRILVLDENPNLKTLGSFFLYWHNIEENYTAYDGTNSVILDFLDFDDSELSLITKLNYFQMNQSDSIYQKALELYFLDAYWNRTRDVHAVDRIFELRDSINGYYEENLPRTELSVSNILWKSNIFGDRDRAYDIIKNQFEKYPEKSVIINNFSEMSFALQKTEYVDKLYANYNLKDDYNESTMLYFIYAFLDTGNKETANNIAKNLLNRSTNNYNKAKVYELFGNYTDDLEAKAEYYRLSLEHRYSNGEILGKLGLTLYEIDPDGYAEQARAFLNAAVAYGYNSPNVSNILSSLRWKLIFNNFLKFMLPFIIITILGVYFIIKWERWKRDDDLGKHILDNN